MCPIPPRSIVGFGGTSRLVIRHKAKIDMKTTQGANVLEMLVMPTQTVSPIEVPDQELLDRLKPQSVSVGISDSPLEEVDLVVGGVHFIQHFLANPQRSIPVGEGMAAIETRLGWYLVGGKETHRTEAYTVTTKKCLCEEVEKLLRDPLSSRDAKDQTVEEWVQSFLKEVYFDKEERRWVVPLLWISQLRPTNNRGVVYRIAQSQLKRLTERGTRERYDKAINEYVTGDYAEEVYDNPEDAYYFTHHSVEKPGSTTTDRIVLNASFTTQGGRSLNDCQYKGLSEQNNLRSLLVRWRLHPYAVTADLQKAFLQIRVKPEDRKYLRYFWAAPGSTLMRTFQMKSVIFGATASPFLLYAVLRKMFSSAPEEEIQNLVESIYMDDVFFLGNDADTVRRKITIASRIFEESSFLIHKWACPFWMRDQGFNYPETKRTVRCLGILWNLESDTISCDVHFISPSVVTRREVLRQFSRVYDPNGWLGPYLTNNKLFTRKVFLATNGWDTPLKRDLEEEARVMFTQIEEAATIKMPRAVRQAGRFDVLGFADASSVAYGAVLYIRDLEKGTMHVLTSRSRLASEKRTIPELELCAAVLLGMLFQEFKTDLKDAQTVHFFSDSMVTLARIRKSLNKYDQYVARRLATIAANTRPEQWHHVGSADNPADALSRGLTIAELKRTELWFKGPPRQVLLENNPQTTMAFVTRAKLLVEPLRLDTKLLEMDYSALIKFLTGYYRVIEEGLRLATRENQTHATPLSNESLAMAAAWRLFQRVAFPEEVASLKKGNLPSRNSPLYKSNVFLDKRGIMRLNRRLENAPLDYEAQFPIIAKDHPFVVRFLTHYHESTLAHCSLRRFKIEVKNLLHLPESNHVLRRIMADCQRCQWLHGRPFEAPPASLPPDRVGNTVHSPFLNIGVDLFGPLQSKRPPKRYGMIFTCANTRAVHLELIPSRSTQCILRAFARFVARRGTPTIVRSDNEKSFRKANPLLHLVFTDLMGCRERLLEKYRFEWIFQPAGCPFWGGFWERLVGVVKKTMANWNMSRAYSFEELTTILSEVEALVNSRPLITGTEQSSPLIPAQFLIGRSLAFVPPLRMDRLQPVDDTMMNYVDLRKARDELWERLLREYLVALRHFHRLGTSRKPRVNELVLVTGPFKRNDWAWGKIVRLMKGGNDDDCRAVQLLMPNGEFWEKPVSKIIPLEADLPEDPAPPGECGATDGATGKPESSSADSRAISPPSGSEAYEKDRMERERDT